jgi:hypothetical protein
MPSGLTVHDLTCMPPGDRAIRRSRPLPFSDGVSNPHPFCKFLQRERQSGLQVIKNLDKGCRTWCRRSTGIVNCDPYSLDHLSEDSDLDLLVFTGDRTYDSGMES